jgi:hypothetical protein
MLALVFLANPTVGRSQGTSGGSNPALVAEIKGLVDIVFQAMQQNAPNPQINHLNQALHQLLMALEGKGGGGHHGKHHRHNHGQGLAMVGFNGSSSATGNTVVVGQIGRGSGNQGIVPAFSRMVNTAGIFHSPGSRLIIVERVVTPTNNGGTFTKVTKQKPARSTKVSAGAGNNTNAKNLNHQAKVQPKSTCSTALGTIQISGKIHTKTGLCLMGDAAKGIGGSGTGINLCMAKKAVTKNDSQNQALTKGRTSNGSGSIGAGRRHANNPSPTVAKASASHKNRK